jgi:hypothetical protein
VHHVGHLPRIHRQVNVSNYLLPPSSEQGHPCRLYPQAMYDAVCYNTRFLPATLYVVTWVKGEGKGKGHPRTGHESPDGEKGYTSTLSLPLALDGVGGQRHVPAALPLGKTRYPLHRRLGGPLDRSGQVRKTSPPPGLDPRTVQPVASRYTD